MHTLLITGGSGLIGSALTDALLASGHTVRHLGRGPGRRPDVAAFRWDPDRGEIDGRALEGVDGIVHLAGAGIADERWSQRRVQALIDSRVRTADLLRSAVLRQRAEPKVLVSAAGINYYGSGHSDHVFQEQDPAGTDTIARISSAWEQAVDNWSDVCRVVKLRTPVVLARTGPLQQLAAPVRWGLGAPLGTGRQWMPWVHLQDLVAIYQLALSHPTMVGAYNVNTGAYVRNHTFMRTMAAVLHRPYFLPAVPTFVLRLALGELSTILTGGVRADNGRLLATGFRFRYLDLRPALTDLLGPTTAPCTGPASSS